MAEKVLKWRDRSGKLHDSEYAADLEDQINEILDTIADNNRHKGKGYFNNTRNVVLAILESYDLNKKLSTLKPWELLPPTPPLAPYLGDTE